MFVVAKDSRLLYLLNASDKSGSEELIKGIEQGLKKFDSQISRQQKTYINTNICLLRFQTQNYRGLVDSLNNTFSLIGRDEKMQPLLLFLKLLEVMAHFSLKNNDLLEYQLRNTERWLKEHKLNEPFTDTFLKSFPSMHIEPQHSAIKKQLSTLSCPPHLQSLKTLVLEWMDANPPIRNSSAKKAGQENANLVASRNQY